MYDNSMLQHMIKLKEQKRQEEYRKQKELEDCTFQPNVNKKKVRGGLNTFIQRQYKWMDMKNMRRDRMAELKKENELRECTFKPGI